MSSLDSTTLRATTRSDDAAPVSRPSGRLARAKRVAPGFSALARIGCWSPAGRKTLAEAMGEITGNIGVGRVLVTAMGLREKRVTALNELLSSDDLLELERNPEKLGSMKRKIIIEMAVAAANTVFEQGTYDGERIRKSDIDLVIYCSVSRAYCEPATAVVVQERLGLRGASSFDLTNACLGFTDAWLVADSMIASGRIRNALLVSAEPASHISDICRDRINDGENPREYLPALSLGDGAVAALVRPKQEGSKEIGLVASTRETFCKDYDLCILPDLLEPMTTQGRKLLESGVRNVGPLARAVLDGSRWTTDGLDACIMHQVSMPFADNVVKALAIPEKTKKFHTFPQHGNMASVSAPFTLGKYIEGRGDWAQEKILYLGFGSGVGIAALTLTT